jgi:hypothetical protein
MRNDFCIFILSHGRADNVKTVKLLDNIKYNGKYFIIVDTDDKQIDDYIKNFGADKILIFDKDKEKDFDLMDNFYEKKAIVYARNICFKFARQLGIKYFMEFDDDYVELKVRFNSKIEFTAKTINLFKNKENFIEKLIDEMINFFLTDRRITTIAFSQGGDFVGGSENNFADGLKTKRKAMNSFLCSTDREFRFFGTLNEDVNLYCNPLEKIIFTVNLIALEQMPTQSQEGGLSNLYEAAGTYVKSFYSVISNPAAVKIQLMGRKEKRFHHSVSYKNTCACILDEKYKKTV